MASNCENALNARQEQAAIRLAGGATVTETATALGLNRTTVSEWQHIPAFEALVNQLLSETRSEAKARISQLGTKATAVLDRLLDSSSERISSGILEQLPRLHRSSRHSRIHR